MDWFDLLEVQGTLKSLLQHHSSKVSILQHSTFFMVQLLQSCVSQVVLVVKNLPANTGELRAMDLIPGPERSPGRRHGNPLQYCHLKNPHGQRSLTGYSPWGLKELDMTEAT